MFTLFRPRHHVVTDEISCYEYFKYPSSLSSFMNKSQVLTRLWPNLCHEIWLQSDLHNLNLVQPWRKFIGLETNTRRGWEMETHAVLAAVCGRCVTAAESWLTVVSVTTVTWMLPVIVRDLWWSLSLDGSQTFCECDPNFKSLNGFPESLSTHLYVRIFWGKIAL